MRILHVFRSPVGGLFRHVRDLARGQRAMGHDVAMLCDSTTGGSTAQALLEDAAQHCTIGVAQLAMSRLPGPGDLKAIKAVRAFARHHDIDVVHGHGAKGGLYARLAAEKLKRPSYYTPHGGSLHYDWKSPAGAAFLSAEKYLARKGTGFVFVCDFERQLFTEKIGLAGKSSAVIHNGLWPEEFAPALPSIAAKDLLYVGELRSLKGIDLLIDAVAQLKDTRKLSLAIVGDGPDEAALKIKVKALGLDQQVSFEGRRPIREAFKLGRMMIVPSRNESFPYVVLEAAAAAMPLLATNVGGIPEILPEHMLITEISAPAMAQKIDQAMADFPTIQGQARTLSRLALKDFSAAEMARKITSFYAS